MKNVIKLSEQELRSGNKTSWHDQYRNSAWIFIGGLPYDLSEGNIFEYFFWRCFLQDFVFRRYHLRLFAIRRSCQCEHAARQEDW